MLGLLAALGCSAGPGAGAGERPGAGEQVVPDGARSGVEIHFLDVGQGDAILVRSPEGRTALIDAGPSDPVPALRELGVERLDLVVATHGHADHIGGMDEVLRAFPVGSYMDNGTPHTTATWSRLAELLRARTDIRYLEASPRTLTLGSVRLEVLPLPDDEELEQNDRSVVLVLRYGRFAALLTGDAEVPAVTRLVHAGVVPDVAVLKGAHHGSRNGVTRAFLRAARPEVVVLSLGAGNSYGHPHPEALEAYRHVTPEIYRTDRHGRITVIGHEDGSWTVRTER